jgi:hypothetical protein
MHHVDASDRDPHAVVVDEDRFPFEARLITGADLVGDGDLQAREGVAHAVVEGADFGVAFERTGYGMEDGALMEVGQDTRDISAFFGAPV